MNAEVKGQEKLEIAEEKNFRREELPEKYIAKMLYEWDSRRSKNKYLKKLERNWERWKGKNKTIWGDKTSSSGSRNLEREVISDLQSLDPSFF